MKKITNRVLFIHCMDATRLLFMQWRKLNNNIELREINFYRYIYNVNKKITLNVTINGKDTGLGGCQKP